MSPNSGTATTGTSTPIRVFVIDDHRSILWGLEQLINGERPRMQVVGTATSSADARQLVREVQPDVILLDLDLGGEHGADLIPMLLSEANATILVLTGVRDVSMHDKAVLAGAHGVLGKEEAPADILKVIEKVYEGEFWLNRASTRRLFVELSRQHDKVTEDPDQARIALLTSREREIVAEVVTQAGAPTKIVAEALHISDRTLRNHLSTIYNKLELSNRLELFVYANKFGLGKP